MGIKMPRIIHEVGVGNRPYTAEEEAAADKEAADRIEFEEKFGYIEQRRYEYPTIEELIVALAEKEEGDSTMWDEISAKRTATKTKHPKPAE